MAVIKMGAIVTEISGSVGGTTFKRGRNSQIMMNKTKGASKNRLLPNSAISSLIQVVQEWSALTTTVQTNWNDASLLFQFPDKFGTLKYLSGRQLYIKLISQIRFSTFPDPDPTTLNSTVAPIEISSGLLVKGGVASIILDANYVNLCQMVQVQQIKNLSTNPVYNKRKSFAKEGIIYTDTVTFTNDFWNRYPYAEIGDNYRVYCTPINKSGFKGVTKFINLVIT